MHNFLNVFEQFTVLTFNRIQSRTVCMAHYIPRASWFWSKQDKLAPILGQSYGLVRRTGMCCALDPEVNLHLTVLCPLPIPSQRAPPPPISKMTCHRAVGKTAAALAQTAGWKAPHTSVSTTPYYHTRQLERARGKVHLLLRRPGAEQTVMIKRN